MPTAVEGGRTKRRADFRPGVGARVGLGAGGDDDLERNSGMRTADRADLVGVLARVGRSPADDLADLRLPVAVQHDDAELVGEPPRLQGRQRRGDAADVTQRREVGDVARRPTASPSPRAAAQSNGSRSGRPAPRTRRDRTRPSPRSRRRPAIRTARCRSRHSRRATPARDSALGARGAPSAAPSPPQRSEHAVEELEVVRRGCAAPVSACRSCPTST